MTLCEYPRYKLGLTLSQAERSPLLSSIKKREDQLCAHRIEHKVLCDFQDDIHQMVRLATAALLFEEHKESFLEREVQHILEKILLCLQQTYGAHQEAFAKTSATALLWEISALEHLFRADIEAALRNDPATHDPLEVIVCYPGYKAIRYHRIAHIFYRHGLPLVPRLTAELAHQDTGIDIHPGAQIGAHFFIDHGTGVVIGETAVIGKYVTIYQGVTLGAKRFQRDEWGTVVKGKARHPIIGDHVTIYAGATILGRIHIGEHASIGGNVWITENVPASSKVTQGRFIAASFRDGDGI